MTPRQSRIVLLASLAALVLLTWGRIALIDHLHDQGYFAKYVEFADRILAGHPPRDRIGDVSPAWLWLVVLFRAAGMGLHAIRNTEIAMLSLAALFAGIAAKRLGGWIAAIAAAALILGNRAALVNATELEPETLILLLNAAALAVLPRSPWLSGALIGLAAVSRPTSLVTLVLIVLWVGWQSQRAALQLAAAALVPIVIVLCVNRTLTGQTIIMQPGTVFYEANNPLSTGCFGVMPRVIADLNAEGPESDYLHVAYRIVAARATGQQPDPRLSNRYWSGKAFASIRAYPLHAMKVFAWKAVLAVHHYDIYDLITTRRKADELARWPAIPFGVSFVLALVALALCADKRRDLVAPLLIALATFAALVTFNVSSRQRNALLAPLAILGGAGAAAIVRLARQRNERAFLAFGAAVILTPILGIEGAPMREDAYNWWATLQGDAFRDAAIQARAQGDRPRAAAFAAEASILRIEERPLVSAATLVPVALGEATKTSSPQRLFDIAIALEKGGAWIEANAILKRIADYEPLRENRAVSSIAYYRARAAIHLHAPPAVIAAFIDDAESQAPGDPDVLALRAVLGDATARTHLDALHDPFTRDDALARAYADLGDTARANALLEGIRRRLPEWKRE